MMTDHSSLLVSLKADRCFLPTSHFWRGLYGKRLRKRSCLGFIHPFIHPSIYSDIVSIHIVTSNHSSSQSHPWTVQSSRLTWHLHVFGWWGQGGVPGENPRSHRENVQTPHGKAQPGLKAGPFSAVGHQSYPLCRRAVLVDFFGGRVCQKYSWI